MMSRSVAGPQLDAADRDIIRSFTGVTSGFRGLIDTSQLRESYYLCSLGFFVRIIRDDTKNVLGEPSPAILEFFDASGKKFMQKMRGFEPADLFFLSFEKDVRDAEFFELNTRPSMIPKQNMNRIPSRFEKLAVGALTL